MRGFVAVAVFAFATLAARAETLARVPGTITVSTRHGFDALLIRVERAVQANRMGLVALASASREAAGQGVKIPGNAVVMVFRNDFAVPMLEAGVPPGIEALLRIYVTGNRDGTSSLTYRKPIADFAAYGSGKLDAMAKELDSSWVKIVSDAASG